MEPNAIVLITLIHASIAIFATTMNLVVAQRRIFRSSRTDSRRLRTALAAELSNLIYAYRNNISAIYENKNVIQACRSLASIYRGNLGRIHTLQESEIPSIVDAYAFSEIIEGFLAAHCKVNGSSSYSMTKERAYANELTDLYEKGVHVAEKALASMRDVERLSHNGLLLLGGKKLVGIARRDIDPVGAIIRRHILTAQA